LRDFDEHLLFASANERPFGCGTDGGIDFLSSNLHQCRTVYRWEKNSYRVLVVQGFNGYRQNKNSLMSTLPTDQIENRLMVEVHYYTPWNSAVLHKMSRGASVLLLGQDYHSATDTTKMHVG